MHDDRRSLNALYGDNRLKLGVFGANVSNGCAATTAPGRLEMNWPNGSEQFQGSSDPTMPRDHPE